MNMKSAVYIKLIIFGICMLMINDVCAKSSIEPNIGRKVQPEAFETITSNPRFLGQQAQENNAQFSRVANHSPHSRFMHIKINPKAAANEIDFWVRQLSEHALFLHLGLEDKKLKKEALRLHTKFEHFRRKFNEEHRDIHLMNSVLPLIEKEREFKVQVLNRLESGEWLGWLFPLFVNHTILELDYLVDKLNGVSYGFQEELQFWNRINSEHALFASHLLDPKERTLMLAADAAAQKFNQTGGEYNTMLQLSLRASKELDAFNKEARAAGKNVQSVIHPVLLDHVIREGERSIVTLSGFPESSEEEGEMGTMEMESDEMLQMEQPEQYQMQGSEQYQMQEPEQYQMQEMEQPGQYQMQETEQYPMMEETE